MINTQMQALLQIVYDNTLGRNPQYAFTNLAVIVDQAHNRVLIFPMPN